MVNIPPIRAPMELEEIIKEVDFCILFISATHRRDYLVKNYNYVVINFKFCRQLKRT